MERGEEMFDVPRIFKAYIRFLLVVWISDCREVVEKNSLRFFARSLLNFSTPSGRSESDPISQRERKNLYIRTLFFFPLFLSLRLIAERKEEGKERFHRD